MTRDPDVGPAAEMTLRLGAWNINKLGRGSSKDYAAVAEVNDAHFDIVGIVEVMRIAGGIRPQRGVRAADLQDQHRYSRRAR